MLHSVIHIVTEQDDNGQLQSPQMQAYGLVDASGVANWPLALHILQEIQNQILREMTKPAPSPMDALLPTVEALQVSEQSNGLLPTP